MNSNPVTCLVIVYIFIIHLTKCLLMTDNNTLICLPYIVQLVITNKLWKLQDKGLFES